MTENEEQPAGEEQLAAEEQLTAEQRERLQRERAEATIRAVTAGGNPGDEALKLANQYSDEWLDRATAKLRRLFRRR